MLLPFFIRFESNTLILFSKCINFWLLFGKCLVLPNYRDIEVIVPEGVHFGLFFLFLQYP